MTDYYDYYQGCGGKVKGDNEEDKIAALNRLEKTREWVAEPKFDGIWAAAFTDDGKTRFISRNGKEKSLPDLAEIPIPEGTVLIGELAYGSQEANTRRSLVGHSFMDVFDIARYEGTSLISASYKERMEILTSLYYNMDTCYSPRIRSPWYEWYLKTPRWVESFERHYLLQPEGLVLKHKDDEYYHNGKNKLWLKAKKIYSNEYIILDWEKSEAYTKSSEPMAESITCGGWVPSSEVLDEEVVYDKATILHQSISLIPLVSVGSMSHEMSRNIAQDFSKWNRQVIQINHYKLFDSGACRHPFVATKRGDVILRMDKNGRDCLYRSLGP